MVISSFVKKCSAKIGTCPQNKLGPFLQVANLASYRIRKSKTAHTSMVDPRKTMKNHPFEVSEDFEAARCSKRKKKNWRLRHSMKYWGVFLWRDPCFSWFDEIIPHITGWGFQPPLTKSPGKQPNGAPLICLR